MADRQLGRQHAVVDRRPDERVREGEARTVRQQIAGPERPRGLDRRGLVEAGERRRGREACTVPEQGHGARQRWCSWRQPSQASEHRVGDTLCSRAS
jgi:hypothetical protein